MLIKGEVLRCSVLSFVVPSNELLKQKVLESLLPIRGHIGIILLMTKMT